MSYNLIGILGFGIFFAIYGAIAIARRQTIFRLGRGRGSLPMTLSGICAVVAGAGFLIGGMVMFIPILRAYCLGRIIADDTVLNVAGAAGLVIAIAGLGFAFVMQALINLGESIGRSRNKNT